MTDLQRGSMLKRISALILDFILIVVLATGAGFAVSGITGYDGYSERLDEVIEKYEKEFNVRQDITAEEYEKLSEEEKAHYQAADEAIKKDEDALYLSSMVTNLAFVIVSIGILLSFSVLEFAIPLCFKNGQTIGKKIFGLGVMQTAGIRLQPFLLFVRAIVGKCMIAAMIPATLVLMILFGMMDLTGVIVIGLIYLLELILVCATRTHSAIHDLFAGTVVIDMASQRIFDSNEEKLAYQKKLAAEIADKSTY